MLVLSSPSGAGKTTLSRELLKAEDDLQMSVSATTREPRPGEVDGVDYIFVDKDRFSAMRDGEEFLEWALVFEHFYGTPRKPVEDALRAGKDVLFDIDWQGTQQLQKTCKSDLVTVFVLPPSMQALEERLKTRAQDSQETVRKRMAGAANEIQHWKDYDYVVVNDRVEASLDVVRAILAAERSKRQRCEEGLTTFVRGLQSQL